MATLAANEPNIRVLGNMNDIPMIAADIIYEGAMVGDNGAGYARPLVAGDEFLGHCMETINNSAGAAGDKTVKVWGGNRYRMSVALVGVITDYAQPVYASDDGTVTFSAGTGNTYVGVITRYQSATRMEVEFRPGEQDEWGSRIRVTTAVDLTTTVVHVGTVIYVTVTTKIVTLLTAVAGHEFTIVNPAAFGDSVIVIDPQVGDSIIGGSGFSAGGAGKTFTNTKLTAHRGDFLSVIFGGTNTWTITGGRGVWAIQS
jgi:hypothetical protein